MGQNVDFLQLIFGVENCDFVQLCPMGFWCHFGAKSCNFGSENVNFWHVEKQPFWEVNFGLKKGDFGSKCRFLMCRKTAILGGDFWTKKGRFWV